MTAFKPDWGQVCNHANLQSAIWARMIRKLRAGSGLTGAGRRAGGTNWIAVKSGSASLMLPDQFCIRPSSSRKPSRHTSVQRKQARMRPTTITSGCILGSRGAKCDSTTVEASYELRHRLSRPRSCGQRITCKAESGEKLAAPPNAPVDGLVSFFIIIST